LYSLSIGVWLFRPNAAPSIENGMPFLAADPQMPKQIDRVARNLLPFPATSARSAKPKHALTLAESCQNHEITQKD
jgi:hypothetical protein